jgi:hypothetical protein
MRLRLAIHYKTILVISTMLLFTYVFMGCNQPFSPPLADKVDFNYDIRPILVQKCYLCHGPDPSSRKGNLRLDTYEGATTLTKEGNKAIDPIHSEKSMLLFRINHKDPDIMMPTPDSKLKLTEREIALIKKWITQGAEWKPYWAFIPPKETDALKDYSGNTVDYFINKKLEENNLSVSATADKNTLIRRVSYVLTGLPPTPAAIQNFLGDKSQSAYPKLVEQYLQSPEFGERWARHWMDLVRYAETKGHEFDYTIAGAWRYRDYLIRAFNTDVPYDQLVREQLAGDLLEKPRINVAEKINESQLGTVFYAMAEGTHSPVDIRKDASDRIDNMIDVTGKAFQALTIACARCHDHKFDPISTKDYYSFYGLMEGTRFSPIPANLLETSKKTQQLQLIEDSIRIQLISSWLKKQTPANAPKAIAAAYHLQGRPKEDSVLGNFLESDLDGWKSDGLAFGNSTTLGDPVFNAQHKLMLLQDGKASSRKLAIGIFGALRSPDFTINKNFIGVKAAGNKASIRIVIDNFQLIQYPIYGGIDQRVDTSQFINFIFDLSQWKGHNAYIEVLPGVYESHDFKMKKESYIEVKYAIAFEKKWFEPATTHPKSNQPAQSIQAILDNKGSAADVHLVNSMIQSNRLVRQLPDIDKLLQKKLDLEQSFTDSTEFFNGVADGFGKNSPVFIRGNCAELSPQPVNRAFLHAIKVSNPDLNVKGSGRLQLAYSITDANNPLTYRVMVNRIWHHLFGRGIVETVDNFGMQGKLPSHPELLDQLAIQFQKDHYSIKKIIRNIVLSDAFQRSVVPNNKAAKTDPSNTLLSHYPVRRLEAEAIRDAMLASSEQLDKKMFGRSVPVHITSFMNGRGKPSKSGPLDGDRRRSIYMEVRRNFMDPMMMTFDRPNPFNAFGRRTVTNVPSQSLILLNDPFVIQQAAAMATHLLSKKISSSNDRIDWVYQRSLSRNATKEEIEDAELFILQLKNTYAKNGIKRNIEWVIWKDYIHSVFNLKEFIYLN